VPNAFVGQWPGPRDPQRLWSNKLLGENPARLLWAGGDGTTTSSTFLKASSKYWFIAQVLGGHLGMKVLEPFLTLLASADVMPSLEALLLATPC